MNYVIIKILACLLAFLRYLLPNFSNYNSNNKLVVIPYSTFLKSCLIYENYRINSRKISVYIVINKINKYSDNNIKI